LNRQTSAKSSGLYDILRLETLGSLCDIKLNRLTLFEGLVPLTLDGREMDEDVASVFLLDCAPTGESLRFISLPTTLEWYMKRVFHLERSIARLARPLVSGISPVPLPGDAYFRSIQDLWVRLEGVDALLKDPKVTTVRLVTNPEKMVIKETQRAFMYFCLYGMALDAVVINRILPREVRDSYFEAWHAVQERYVRMAEEAFAPLPTFRVPLQSEEVLGMKGLNALGRQIYKEADPAELFATAHPYRFEKRDGVYRLVIALPFVGKKDVDLNVSGDELIVRIGTFKRYVPLPRSYQGTLPTGATLRDDELTITFGGRDGKTEGAKKGGQGRAR